MMGLTELQRDMLEALRELTVDGVAPSFIELKEHMGLASKSQVHRLLTQLEDRGCIRRLRCRARAIEVIPQDHSIDRLVWSVPLADLPAMRAAIDRSMAP